MARGGRGYPGAVAAALEALRKKSEGKLSISIIRGRYCVYEYSYVRDNKTGSVRKHQFYIGWISEDGTVNPARHRFERTRVSGIGQYIEAHAAEGTGDYASVHPDSIDRRILTELSMDSRASAPSIAKKAGVSRSAVTYRLEKLGKSYGIRKTIEIFPERFGFTRYMVTVKFIGGRPDVPAMKALFEGEPRVQMVLMMRGDYDMLVYIVAESTKKLDNIIYKLRSSRVFVGVESAWQVGYMIEAYGFVPFRAKFFDLLEERIWKKSRESPRREAGQLLPSEYAVMKEMNADAGVDFIRIDEDYGLHRGSAQYTYHRLLERKVIERSTIMMGRLPLKYCGFIYIKQTDMNAFNLTRKEQLMEIIEETDNPANRYALVADVSSPYGVAFITPVFEHGIEETVERMERRIKGIEIETAIITEQLVGFIGLRRFDNAAAPQVEMIRSIKA